MDFNVKLLTNDKQRATMLGKSKDNFKCKMTQHTEKGLEREKDEKQKFTLNHNGSGD